MANAYWAEYVNDKGFATLQQLIARSESGARIAFNEIEYYKDDDSDGTIEVRLTKNGDILDTIKRESSPR